ncbi:MAG: pantoate--beta-alanine ligase [Thermoanaerobaculia bacterium]
MRTIQNGSALAAEIASYRAAGEKIAFVPTMGALHDGHLSLVALARSRASRVVASIFVNPSQFAPHEDFDAYPRPLARDSELLAGAGCDILFAPDRATVYPPGFGTWIEPQGAALGFESAIRPHFFRGVATVVARLFGLVHPDLAVFGEKDYQQLLVIRRMARDLDLGVEVVGCPIVREADGLAMSSRNIYLSGDERRQAPRLHAGLVAARELFGVGERNSDVLKNAVAREIAAAPSFELQYVEIVEVDRFTPLPEVDDRGLVILAAKLGSTRLIDNLKLER